jgi:hypothetical protein
MDQPVGLAAWEQGSESFWRQIWRQILPISKPKLYYGKVVKFLN